MRLRIVLTALFQVVMSKPPDEVSGYTGGNVTLPSGADPSWTLSRIDWSIFSNNTLIATYRSQTTNVNRVHTYLNRLTLNQTSGDLTIHNLKPGDAMDYTVNLLNTDNENKEKKIGLKVKQHLQQPTIKEIQNTATGNGCFMLLSCSSLDDDVDFSWKVTPHYLYSWNNTKGGPSQLLAYFNTQASVKFTCTSSRQMENRSKVFHSKCIVAGETPGPRHRCGVGISCIVVGVFSLMVLIYCLRGHFVALGCYLREKLCPSRD
ncbi:uncharacterized protein si:cabz01074946.1 [Kryptolebias marmoratus]|uniref:Uncharacterized LOC108248848 n=1 Tax=Kryptolebias marmoratus TaxID=37003 RepID=A0A3Q3AS03_KRYMA|nr:uncharacterized protein si:cabz01074946.1 [Kryptolebias marmoratus]XP_017293353.1 uncharacterized protein si:cabz01074946.1 [Kryptolebias marmoratus]XP_017293354.1 uncharacterized protein si:cabz01074946.1 [Kryptolebias marmoratus]XP_017293355.1 uncharacterized protein si:cabz01074946.1 [Kryptolebias marmoratus]XP_017293356.1 uncharacterized protein si:cabz01074946.1 [Kryptolebias marmoratus]XP_017293357.1 uncharacterized protein si:cabz01074946.1 [Kryptolebias marmoratus]